MKPQRFKCCGLYGYPNRGNTWKYVKGASLANLDFGDTSSLRQAITEVFAELNSNPESDLTLRFRDPRGGIKRHPPPIN